MLDTRDPLWTSGKWLLLDIFITLMGGRWLLKSPSRQLVFLVLDFRWRSTCDGNCMPWVLKSHRAAEL
jgi:hypothetical protein